MVTNPISTSLVLLLVRALKHPLLILSKCGGNCNWEGFALKFNLRKKFPFFRRWIKVTATDDPAFASAVEARHIFFDFMAMRAANVQAMPLFSVERHECFRPSATMLTSAETDPDASVADIPPLENAQPFEAAVNAAHGKFLFSTDNEVLIFGEEFLNG